MAIRLGDVFPNFKADSTEGTIQFHDWLGNSWGMIFSHPRDYTPVCTTELGEMVKKAEEFKKRGVKLLAISCDSVADHNSWSKDVMCFSGKKDGKFPYPIVADTDRSLGVQLGMIDPDEISPEGLPLTARAVFIIGPDKKLKLSILYPATTGRNFDEILRAIDSLLLTSKNKVATPAGWTMGKPVMVVPGVSNEEAKKLFPDFKVTTVPSGKEYLRMTMDYKH